MAATETSSALSSSLLRPLSPSQKLEKNFFKLKKRSTAAATPSSAVSNPRKRKCCMCFPTTNPGSFLCAVHRKLENDFLAIISYKRKPRRSAITKCKSGSNEKKIGTLGFKPRRRTGGITTSDSGLNLRKTAILNSLAEIGGVEAERCRKYLKESMVKPLSLRCRCRYRPRPRPSRFYALHQDED